jgi:hypothetical protein
LFVDDNDGRKEGRKSEVYSSETNEPSPLFSDYSSRNGLLAVMGMGWASPNGRRVRREG